MVALKLGVTRTEQPQLQEMLAELKAQGIPRKLAKAIAIAKIISER